MGLKEKRRTRAKSRGVMPEGIDSRVEEFVWIWQTSESAAEVSQRYGTKESYCATYATQLRGVGVDLQYFPPRRRPRRGLLSRMPRVLVERLKELAKEYAPK